MHFVNMFICAYREIYEAKINTVGQIMRFVETFAVLVQIKILLGCLHEILKLKNFDIELTDYVKSVLTAYNLKQPLCLKSEDDIHKFGGRSTDWFAMEVITFFMYLITMTLYMIKSRFMSVGVNQSTQFEPLYMSYMAQKLIENINFHHIKHK